VNEEVGKNSNGKQSEMDLIDKVEISKILLAFEIYDGIYKRHYVDAALELKEEITPYLIKELEKVLADPSTYANEKNYYAHIYAAILLAHFKEYSAHHTIVKLFSLPDDIVSKLYGGLIHETLTAILFRTCNGNMDLIKSLILNKEANEYCRSSAMKTMVYAADDGMIARDEVLAFFGSLFTGSEAECTSYFWTGLAHCVYDLYPEELMDVIEQAYQDELIPSGWISLEDFKAKLEEGKKDAFDRIKENRQRTIPDNVHDYISWWACFKTQKRSPASLPLREPVPKKKKPSKNKKKMMKASKRKNRKK